MVGNAVVAKRSNGLPHNQARHLDVKIHIHFTNIYRGKFTRPPPERQRSLLTVSIVR